MSNINSSGGSTNTTQLITSEPPEIDCNSDVESYSSEPDQPPIDFDESCDESNNETENSSEFFSANNLDSDEDLDTDNEMFERLYENATIRVYEIYCAIMELKRACRLSFATIAMLLNLLQLLCPQNTRLPHSLYKFKKFFESFSSFHKILIVSHCLERIKVYVIIVLAGVLNPVL